MDVCTSYSKSNSKDKRWVFFSNGARRWWNLAAGPTQANTQFFGVLEDEPMIGPVWFQIFLLGLLRQKIFWECCKETIFLIRIEILLDDFYIEALHKQGERRFVMWSIDLSSETCVRGPISVANTLSWWEERFCRCFVPYGIIQLTNASVPPHCHRFAK